MLDTVDNFMII